MSATLWIAACIGTFMIGGLIGFILCAVISHGKVQDAIDFWDDSAALKKAEHEIAEWVDHAAFAANEATIAQDAHSRAADALLAAHTRINRALACETPNAAHGVRKMAAILRGQR